MHAASKTASVRFKRPKWPRGLSHQTRTIQERQEREHLLASQHDDEEHADSDGLYPPHCCWTSDQPVPPKGSDPFGNADCDVYKNIHRIRRDIMNSIDDPYSLDQLKAPRMNISVVRPLVDTFYEMQDLSIVYCLLVNRLQFIRQQFYAAHHQTVNLTRALLCELLAEKILRRYNEDNPGPKGLLKLANILVAGFEPFQNAPEEIIQNNSHAMHWAVQKKAGKFERKLTAFEVAIVSESKSFLASTACQKIVDAIYRGKIVYSPNSFIDVLPDHYKRKPISLYDPRRAPLLNQYRMIVPRTRNVIEVFQFVILLVLYVSVMMQRKSRTTTKYSLLEGVFDVYTAGMILDQLASILEHGWQVYTQNLWSFLDVTFSLLFIIYAILRIHASTISDEIEREHLVQTAIDVLSCAAPVLIPRLAFNIMSENLLFVSLRAMMSDFSLLTALAVWCFGGFLLSLKWLHNGIHEETTIGKWMIMIWFGLDGRGIDKATDFHKFLGPVIMVLFAFLGNTLFLTILVAMLTNTFSIIVTNAVQEVQFRRAVLVFEGVKSDAIFAYMPPFNILAFVLLLPVKLTMSDRIFHKVHVAATRTINLPILLVIAWYERRTLWMSDKRQHLIPKRIDWNNMDGPRAAGVGWWARTLSFWDFSRFSVHGDLEAVFDVEPPKSVLDEIAGEDDLDHGEGIGKAVMHDLHDQFDYQSTQKIPTIGGRRASANPRAQKKRRRESKASDTLLRQEFADSSSDERETPTSAPKGYHKVRPGARKDSIMDYEDKAFSGMGETNARLQRLEESIKKMEQLLLQLTEIHTGDDVGGDDDENSEGRGELESEIRTGLIE